MKPGQPSKMDDHVLDIIGSPRPRSTGEQPMPVPNGWPSIQGMVRADLEARETLGRERYGTALQAHNGRDALRDAYEEALDLACYLRQAIEERRVCGRLTDWSTVPCGRAPDHPDGCFG